VAQIYNTRDKNYQTIIKQLIDRLPQGSKDVAEDIMRFAMVGRK
jgi:hypothetical protein